MKTLSWQTEEWAVSEFPVSGGAETLPLASERFLDVLTRGSFTTQWPKLAHAVPRDFHRDISLRPGIEAFSGAQNRTI